MRITSVDAATANQHLPDALRTFRDPETGRSLADTNQLSGVQITGNRLGCQLALTTYCRPIAEEVRERLSSHLVARLPGIEQVDIELVDLDRPPTPLGQIGLRVRRVIAVGSGKGGVGKSTVATLLALTLKRFGCRVGLMDADVYGPSVPQLLGLSGRPAVADGKIQPMQADGMPVMSMGFMVERDQAVIWRGPMLHGSITQFLRDTDWGQLDYLIIDMPPGTGDIALTLSQLLPMGGAVVACTPQEVALLDAGKAIAMFRQTKIPVLGLVENMSGFVCPDNGRRYDIFGKGGVRQRAEQLQLPFLGELPITMTLREAGDAGELEAALDDPSVLEPMQAISRQMLRSLEDLASRQPLGPALPTL